MQVKHQDPTTGVSQQPFSVASTGRVQLRFDQAIARYRIGMLTSTPALNEPKDAYADLVT